MWRYIAALCAALLLSLVGAGVVAASETATALPGATQVVASSGLLMLLAAASLARRRRRR